MFFYLFIFGGLLVRYHTFSSAVSFSGNRVKKQSKNKCIQSGGWGEGRGS